MPSGCSSTSGYWEQESNFKAQVYESYRSLSIHRPTQLQLVTRTRKTDPRGALRHRCESVCGWILSFACFLAPVSPRRLVESGRSLMTANGTSVPARFVRADKTDGRKVAHKVMKHAALRRKMPVLAISKTKNNLHIRIIRLY